MDIAVENLAATPDDAARNMAAYFGLDGRITEGRQSNFRLKVPDGTVVAPKMWDSVLLNYNEQARDQPVGFAIRWPAPGAYALQVLDAGRIGNEQPPPGGLAEMPITLTLT